MPCRSRRDIRPAAVALALALSASTAAQAEQWTIDGAMSQRFEFTDNIMLTADDRESAVGSITTPRAVLARRSAVSEISITGEARGNHYFGHSDLDGIEPRVFLQGRYFGARGSWGGSAGYTRELVRRAELSDTGFTTNHGWRKTFQVQPSAQVELTLRDSLAFGASYIRRKYESVPLIGFHSYSSFLEWTHAATQRLTWIASVNATYYESDDALDSRVKVVGAQAGLSYRFSDKLSTRVTGGETWVSGRSERIATGLAISPQRGSSFGALFAGSISYDTDNRRAKLSITRSVQPSGFGTVVQSDVISGDLKQRLGPNLWLDFLGRYQRAQKESGGGANQKRTYYTFGPVLRWKFARQWSLDAAYRYRSQEYTRSNRKRYSNTVDLTVSYHLNEVPFDP